MLEEVSARVPRVSALIACQLRRYRELEFGRAEALQAELVERRQQQQIADQLVLLEHPPTITLGRGKSEQHLLVNAANLQACGIAFARTGRGGDVTFHGPGQLVAYPILELEAERRDLHRYLRDLEQVVIDLCAEYGVQAEREPERTGVWVQGRKLASIGVRASRWVTSHGVAINYHSDLSGFQSIVPCGLSGVQMVSLHNIVEDPVERTALEERFCGHFARIFNRTMMSSHD